MREQRTKPQVKKNNPPTICNNSTMDIEFLVEMRQSDKYGSVRNDDIFNLHWDLVQALESASSAFCKTLAVFIDSICPNNHLRRKRKLWKEIKLSTNHVVLPWPTYTEPRANHITKNTKLGTKCITNLWQSFKSALCSEMTSAYKRLVTYKRLL